MMEDAIANLINAAAFFLVAIIAVPTLILFGAFFFGLIGDWVHQRRFKQAQKKRGRDGSNLF